MDCTQQRLAEVLGVTQDSISLWENDKRVPDTQYVVMLANFFDVTTDYLLGLSQNIEGIKFGHEGREKAWLTKDEQNLLEGYRKLSLEQKKVWLENLKK